MAETLRFGYDGDGGLGDRLLSAVLRGEKTATSSLAVEYLSGESLPRVGQRLTLVDHAGVPRGTVAQEREARSVRWSWTTSRPSTPELVADAHLGGTAGSLV